MTEKLLMFIFIAAASFAAYRLKALTFAGAIMAITVGLCVYYGFGIKGFILLGSFFITSSLWSEYKSAKKATMKEMLAKGSTRDWIQVLANGGTAALLGLIYVLSNHAIWTTAFAVAMASANSDTWASEIGSLSKKDPFDIRTLRRVKKGTSGAISLLGSIAGISGSLFIALLGYFLFHFHMSAIFPIAVFGFTGNIIDTLLGAFFQQKFSCCCCGTETEKKMHCGEKTVRIRGIRGIDNDGVNFLSGFIAVLLAAAVFAFMK